MAKHQGCVRRGELYWVTLDRDGMEGSIPHPHLVVQDDVLNRSRIETTVVCALSSNLNRASEPGNVLLKPGEGGLQRQSVVIVSQISSIEKSELTDYIGKLESARVEQVFAGLGFQQRSFLKDD